MILIAKKQKLAQQSAKTLIDFENIVVDTDFGALSSRSISMGIGGYGSGGLIGSNHKSKNLHLSGEDLGTGADDIVFDVKESEKNALEELG